MRVKALLMSERGNVWETNSSTFTFPAKYRSTRSGTLSRLFHPPKAVPFQTRPVTNWKGRVDISILHEQSNIEMVCKNTLPRSSHAYYCRHAPSLMTSLQSCSLKSECQWNSLLLTLHFTIVWTLPIHSNVKSNPPSVKSTRTCCIGRSWSLGLTNSLAPNE